MSISPLPSDVPGRGSAVDLTPAERFIRDVMPIVPGGPQQVTDSTGHVDRIRRAAKERGLSARTVGKTVYFYDGPRPVGGTTGMLSSLIGRQADDVCRSKKLTKQMLEAAGIPTPAGIALGSDQLDEALTHLRAVGRPSVLKPSSGGRGAGITCGIASEDELRSAWETAERAAGTNPTFVLEEHLGGVDIRMYVVGRRVVAAATRINAYVIGDGRHSIAELVELKQKMRAKNAYLAKRPISVDTALLTRDERTLDDVPAADEVVVLNSISNLHVGGENVDVTELVHPDLCRLAVDAVRAIPGLGTAGVDLLTPDVGSADGAVVLEVNVRANIRVHHQPAYGRPRDVAGAIVDEMLAKAGVPVRNRFRTGVARRAIRRLLRRWRRRRDGRARAGARR